MSDSADGNVPKPAGGSQGEGGDAAKLAADEAERFASAFVPSWQFEEAAPLAPAAASQRDLEEVGASSGVNSDRTMVDSPAASPPPQEDLTAADVDVSGLAARMKEPSLAGAGRQATVNYPGAIPPPAGAAPRMNQTVMGMGMGMGMAGAPDPGRDAAATLVIPPNAAVSAANPVPSATLLMAPATKPQPPAAPPGRARTMPLTAARPQPRPAFPSPAPFSPDDSIEYPIRKSNKGLVIGALVVVAGAAVFIGLRAMGGGKQSAAVAPTQVTATTATAENRIPPPPPVVAPPDTQTAAPLPPPPPVVKTSPPVAGAAAPPAGRPSAPSRPSPPRPPPTPRTPPKSGGGGIVRDNPF